MIKKVFIFLFLVITLSYTSPLNYINSIRQKSGVVALKYSSTLSKAAKKHAIYVYKTKDYSHYEDSSSKYHYASTPWNRIVKAGYKTKVVVENISFVESSFKESINNLMATVYHRLAFLYNQINEIGYARVGSIFVYDMSNSKIATLCNKHYKDAPLVVDSICPNNSDIVPANLFNKEINKIKRASKRVIIYPYSNQKDVPLLGVEETPKFLYHRFGHPISVTFNDYYYKSIKLLSFKLYRGKERVKTKIISAKNDIHKKIRKDTYILVPLHKLKPKTTYKVVLKAKLNGKIKRKVWKFTTK